MKYTIVSLFPMPINEVKPIEPGEFAIPAAKKDDFQVFVSKDAYTRSRYISFEEGSLLLPVDSKEAVDAVCYDLISSLVGTEVERRPGVFVLEGALTKEDVRRDHSEELALHDKYQRTWFEHLVKLADDDWKKYEQHRMITDLSRFACDWLGLKRVWNFNPAEDKMIECVFCTTVISQRAIVCPQCRNTVDPEGLSRLTKPAPTPAPTQTQASK